MIAIQLRTTGLSEARARRQIDAAAPPTLSARRASFLVRGRSHASAAEGSAGLVSSR